MEHTPPSSPTPGTSKDKGHGKGESFQNNTTPTPPTPPSQQHSESKSKPGDALFDNKNVKMALEDIKIAWNIACRAYRKSKKKFLGFIPHFLAPFIMEIATTM